MNQIGQRLADAFRGVRVRAEPGEGDTAVIERLTVAAQDEVLPRFPISRRGYHCASVDDYVVKLEDELAALSQELAHLRARSDNRDEVRTEIERIGEQTSAVLIAAHDQREAILRGAREEADRFVADARTQASRLTADSEARLRELKAESVAVQRARDRLLEDARSVSVALAALVDGAQGRPAEGAASDQAT